ncbi:DivIVA domain-containing protein [Kribbella sp. NPDC054772]|jgi:cell division septum initiation protein DivIVA
MRGLDAGQVYGFLDQLADQAQAAEQERKTAQHEKERLEVELQRVRGELQRVRGELEEYEQVGERVNEQVVQLFSQAQLVAEEMVQDVSRDARERISQARAHERQIVAEAMDTAGEQVRSYARTAHVQMQSLVDSFASEVDRLGSSPATPDPAYQKDPLYDDLHDRQIRSRHGSGPEFPGSD